MNTTLLKICGVLFFLAVIFFLCRYFIPTSSSPSPASFHSNAWKFAEMIQMDVPYPVAHVIDGDTLVANVSGHDLTIRLIGMDTPETVDPRKPVECFGPEASAEAKKLLAASGTEIYLEKDAAVGDYDKYGRILAYVRIPAQDIFYDEFMILQGFAREYTYMNGTYKYQQDFRNAEKAAKAAHLGVWDSSRCPKPFSY